jgi:hypothetical protein
VTCPMLRTGSVVMPDVISTHCQAAITVKIIDKPRLMLTTRHVTPRQNTDSISLVNGVLRGRSICRIIHFVRTAWLRAESCPRRLSIISSESETIPNSHSILPTSSPYARRVTTQSIQRRADGTMTREGSSNIYDYAPFRPAGGDARANADGRFSKVCGKMR